MATVLTMMSVMSIFSLPMMSMKAMMVLMTVLSMMALKLTFWDIHDVFEAGATLLVLTSYLKAAVSHTILLFLAELRSVTVIPDRPGKSLDPCEFGPATLLT